MRRAFALCLAGFIALIGCAKSADDTVPTDDGGAPEAEASAPCTTMCNGACADTKADPMNCGKCGNACPMGASCVQGSCQCMPGQSICNKQCVDTKTDLMNCGKCGQACGGGDAGAIMGGGSWGCVQGTCTIICPMPKVECTGACVDTKTDNDNCGMCGTACASMTEQCVDGQCCKTGQKVCAGMCTDVQSDANNCGMCGNKCSGNTPACAGGMCVACGNDCWSNAGCLTQGGHCIKFSCRDGNTANFCNGCNGWQEVSYSDWMNGGWCGDVIKKYRAVENAATHCGNAATCCSSSGACSGSDNAWHFWDGSNIHVAGPCLGCANDSNCSYWNFTTSGNYTRLTVCKKY